MIKLLWLDLKIEYYAKSFPRGMNRSYSLSGSKTMGLPRTACCLGDWIRFTRIVVGISTNGYKELRDDETSVFAMGV